MRTMCRSRWFFPLFALALGVAVFAAQAIGGHAGSGLVSFGIMAAVGAVFLFGGRSETIRGLRGDGRDERFHRMDIHATAFAGMVVIAAIIVAFVVELARGRDGGPYTWLGAVGGLAPRSLGRNVYIVDVSSQAPRTQRYRCLALRPRGTS